MVLITDYGTGLVEFRYCSNKNVRSGGAANGGSLRMKRHGCRKLRGTWGEGKVRYWNRMSTKSCWEICPHLPFVPLSSFVVESCGDCPFTMISVIRMRIGSEIRFKVDLRYRTSGVCTQTNITGPTLCRFGWTFLHGFDYRWSTSDSGDTENQQVCPRLDSSSIWGWPT